MVAASDLQHVSARGKDASTLITSCRSKNQSAGSKPLPIARAPREPALVARPENFAATSSRHSSGPLVRPFAPRSLSQSLHHFLAAVVFVLTLLCAAPAVAEIELPVGDAQFPIAISATTATHWTQGKYEVWLLKGAAKLTQGDASAQGDEAVLWIDRAEIYSGQPSRVIGYFEGNVQVEFGHRGNPHAVTHEAKQTLVDRIWIGRFQTTAGIQMSLPVAPPQEPTVKPEIFSRGLELRQQEAQGTVVQAQYRTEEIAPPSPEQSNPRDLMATGGRRVQIRPRSSTRWNARSFNDPERNERVTIATSGVEIQIYGIDQLGNVTISTDRLVVWSPQLNMNQQGGSANTNDGPMEFYLEGNITFRQGDRVIYADRMYYNVRQEYGVVLGAEMLTPVEEYQGLLRLKAEVLQQIDRQRFEAYGAALTSSRLGVPRYWFQAQNVNVTDVQTPAIDPFTGQPMVDPQTGEAQIDHQLLAESRDNYIYLAGVPVFYWPVLATDLTKPTYYVDRVRIKSDRVFGQQFLVDLDMYQLLGIRQPPEGTRWSLSNDFLSERGLALGTNFKYEGDTLLGFPGPYRGFIDAWGLHDSGLDILGADRFDIVPEADLRGRVLANHRHILPDGYQFSAEVGLISDRNFLEQYYELEWDTLKDQTTGVELKKLTDNRSWSLTTDVRPNDFFTQTEWLPRFDHFWIGESLLFDKLTWHAHSQIGYGRLETSSTPVAPADFASYSPLAWEAEREGVRGVSRQEIDMPIDVGPVKIVPYLLGEVAYWGEDLTGEDLLRGYAQTGVRASLPVWKADPTIQSELLNLNGLSHKIVYEAEFLYADASQDIDELPLYDALDDDATEHFRRRMAVNTFGQAQGTFVPTEFDERYYALRSNLQGSVTSPSTEIADDQLQVRLGIKQRWQTKRGLAGQERIVDWIVLDVDAVFFPEAERDNFGEELGMLDYDFRWHIGDRLTILSDGYADVFSQGLKQVTLGGVLSRPEYGSAYFGIRSTEGPISSNVVASSLSYRMSEKWILTGGAYFDLSDTGNIGQNFGVTRIGESFLIRLGFTFDASRDNVGLQFAIEPRFLPSSRLGQVGGTQIPPAGAMGIE
ncbi:Organic solvent tolerance protein OstA-like protein [Pirellula staleyi DSM 6068]|uniref:Organic solvent tolerance protein OstA-like protein n=1 Tax=Pirellula staleyi (strain ATCC 27377 / DSM 6068 / ICPB 4128) TaxID=530564 RepID=D2R0D9_PIRSD|nr:Organic solvent tolerance protein OstA-like protein [Pirellula staleyi DSM 6068]